MPWRRIGVAVAVIVAAFSRWGAQRASWSIGRGSRRLGMSASSGRFRHESRSLHGGLRGIDLASLGERALALRFASRRRFRLPAVLDPGFATVRGLPGAPTELFALPSPPLPWRLLILAVALVVGLLIAIGETGKWDLILRFIHQVPYGRNDPLFDKDIGFYLFSLPVYIALKNWMLWILFLSHPDGRRGVFRARRNQSGPRPWRISSAAIAHGSVLLGLFFAVKAWSYALDRFLLLYDDNGVVVGAGYTDVHVELPALWLLIFVAAAAAVVAWANVRLRTYRLAIAAAVLVFGGSFVFAEVFPALFQRFFVKPSELQLESAVHSAEHRPHPGGLQSSADRGEAIPGGTGAEFPVAAGQPRHHRQHPAVGLAAADGHLRATAGDPHLLQVSRCRRRSLPHRRLVSAGDARGPRARRRRCCRPTPRPGSTCICCSPTATGSSCPRSPRSPPKACRSST